MVRPHFTVSKTVLDSRTSVSSENQMGQVEEVNKQNGKRKILDKKQLHGQVYTIIVAVQVYSNN
jgi:hypothetical protein